MAAEFDDLDRALVHALQVDGRAPFRRVGEVLELVSHADLRTIAERLANDTTTLVLVWENLWASGFADAVRAHGGSIVAHDRVPADDVARALADAAAPVPDGSRA